MRKATGWIGCALALSAWPGPAASSDNLLLNPDFDSDLLNWGIYSLGNSLSEDADGCLGSHALTSLSAGHPEIKMQVVWITQCAAFPGPAPAELFARVAVQGNASRLFGILRFYSNAYCTSDTFLSESVVQVFDIPGEWIPFEFSAAVPASAQSVEFRLEYEDDGFLFSPDTDSAILMDRDFVFLDGFEAGETCRWTSASR